MVCRLPKRTNVRPQVFPDFTLARIRRQRLIFLSNTRQIRLNLANSFLDWVHFLGTRLKNVDVDEDSYKVDIVNDTRDVCDTDKRVLADYPIGRLGSAARSDREQIDQDKSCNDDKEGHRQEPYRAIGSDNRAILVHEISGFDRMG
jgi:hypothetical protein